MPMGMANVSYYVNFHTTDLTRPITSRSVRGNKGHYVVGRSKVDPGDRDARTAPRSAIERKSVDMITDLGSLENWLSCPSLPAKFAITDGNALQAFHFLQLIRQRLSFATDWVHGRV